MGGKLRQLPTILFCLVLLLPFTQAVNETINLHFGESMSTVNAGIYEAENGIVADSYHYKQSIKVSDATINFGQIANDGPLFYLDFTAGADNNFYFKADFDSLNITALDNFETINLFGKTYAFDKDHELEDAITLYGSDIKITMTQNELVTLTLEEEVYEIKILNGNVQEESVTLQISKDGDAETETFTLGTSLTMHGLHLFFAEIISIDGNMSINFFIGEEKIIIPYDAVVDDCDAAYKKIQRGNVENTQLYACILSPTTSIDAVLGLYFRINQTDFNNNKLILGDSFTEPLFGYSLTFNSYAPLIDNRPKVTLQKSANSYELDFTTTNGDDYNFPLVQMKDDYTLNYGSEEKFKGSGIPAFQNITVGEQFILESDAIKIGDKVTYIFEVISITSNENTSQVELKDLGTGSLEFYSIGSSIEDTGVTINSTTENSFTLSQATEQRIVAEGGLLIKWVEQFASENTLTLSFTEDTDDFHDIKVADNATFETTLRVTDEDKKLVMDAVIIESTGTSTISTQETNLQGVSAYGTYFIQGIQASPDSEDYLRVHYPETETNFKLTLESPAIKQYSLEYLTLNETPNDPPNNESNITIIYGVLWLSANTTTPGHTIEISSMWNQTNFLCELYTNEVLETTKNTTTNTCQFSKEITAAHYPELRFYIRASNLSLGFNETSNTRTLQITIPAETPVVDSPKKKKTGGGGGGSVAAALPAGKALVKNWLNIPPETQITFTPNDEEFALEQISFTVMIQTNKLRMEVKPLTASSLPTAFPKTSYAFMEILVEELEDANMENIKISFSVDNSWLVENQKENNEVVLYRLQGTTWVPQATTKLLDDQETTNYRANIEGFSYFAIGMQEKKILRTTSTTASKEQGNDQTEQHIAQENEKTEKKATNAITGMLVSDDTTAFAKNYILFGLGIVTLVCVFGIILFYIKIRN
jgi:PGF-pre-PGF domain-containing protein